MAGLLLAGALLAAQAGGGRPAGEPAGSTCSVGPPQPNTGCTASHYNGAEDTASADGCCALCAKDAPKCQAWTYHPAGGKRSGGSCYLAEKPNCRSVPGHTAGCVAGNLQCHATPHPPDPHKCEPVKRPPAPAPAPLPPGIKTAPHIVSIIV